MSGKLRIIGISGKFDKPNSLKLIPITFMLRVHLLIDNGFKISHDINVDENCICEWIHYDKKRTGCGSIPICVS